MHSHNGVGSEGEMSDNRDGEIKLKMEMKAKV